VSIRIPVIRKPDKTKNKSTPDHPMSKGAKSSRGARGIREFQVKQQHQENRDAADAIQLENYILFFCEGMQRDRWALKSDGWSASRVSAAK